MITCPYKGLAPYTEEDARYFFGRDTERRIIADNLRATRLTVLYGPSGVGKSSVLNAGVTHDLQLDRDYALLIFREWHGDPSLSLNLAIVGCLPMPASGPDLLPGSAGHNFLKTLERYGEIVEESKDALPTLLIVLDQFEEYFQYQARDDAESGFEKQLTEVLSRRDLPVHFLLSIRDDSLAALDRFKADVPTLLDNRLSITFLSREAASQAIVEPLERFNADLREGKVPATANNLRPIEIDARLAAAVVDEIVAAQGEEREGVQTAYLQLVMTRWWERQMAGSSEKMLRRTLEELGGVKTIVERYLEDTLATLSPLEKQLAAEAFFHMVTSSGRKIALTVSELAGYIGRLGNKEALEGLLKKLRGARVLTPVPPPPGSAAGERCYEFAHDVVAKSAFEWRRQFAQARKLAEAKKREEEAEQRAKEQARLAEQLRQALETTQRARARELISSSLLNEDTDPELSVLLAAHAVAATWPLTHEVLPEAEQQLRRAIIASHVRLTLSGHNGPVSSVAWSPDEKRLATGSSDKTAKVWDAGNGEELFTLTGHSEEVSSVAWSPDGKRLATGSGDKTAKVWDAASGQALLTLRGHSGRVSSVAWSPDGKRLATASSDKSVKVWDARTGRELSTLNGHGAAVNSVAWSPDGSRLATGSADNTGKVWDAQAGKELFTLRGHSGYLAGVWCVAWSPDGHRLATGSDDNSAKIWSADDGKELLTLSGHRYLVSGVAWGPDGKRLATASHDNTAKVWNAGTGEVLTLRGHGDRVLGVAWCSGERLATASDDRTVKVWEAEKGRELLTLRGHSDEVSSVAWSPDGKRLATGSSDKTVRVWDAENGQELLTLRGHNDRISSIAWSPDGGRLATGSMDNTAKVWSLETGAELLTLDAHSGSVWSVAWSPDGMRLAAGSQDNIAKVWNADTGTELLTLQGHTGPIESLAWSPDGNRLATGSWDGTTAKLRLWDAAAGKEVTALTCSDWRVKSVAWNPDGKRLATGSDDKTARVWDAETGKELLTPCAHKGVFAGVSSVAWSPDGRRLATGGGDAKAKIWSGDTGAELVTLHAHSGRVSSVAWSPDGKRLATASEDGTVQIYALDIHDLMELARQRVTAHPSQEGCKRFFHVDQCPPVPQLSS